MRELYERLRKVLQKHGKDKVLWLHEWDRYHPAYASFGDLIYPGEEFMHKIRVNRRVYGEETPLEQWQVAYNSEVNGAAVQFTLPLIISVNAQIGNIKPITKIC